MKGIFLKEVVLIGFPEFIFLYCWPEPLIKNKKMKMKRDKMGRGSHLAKLPGVHRTGDVRDERGNVQLPRINFPSWHTGISQKTLCFLEVNCFAPDCKMHPPKLYHHFRL